MSLTCTFHEMVSNIWGTMYDLFGGVDIRNNVMHSATSGDFYIGDYKLEDIRLGHYYIEAPTATYKFSLVRHDEPTEEGNWTLIVDWPWNHPNGMIHDLNVTLSVTHRQPVCTITIYPESIDDVKCALNYFASKIKEQQS